ncbi:Phosphatidylcholine:ceramide cholinephosphotransferase 1 [Collichthys lucidus]|uniref:Phosphatidylcholine:ceramide cholinephosphotransferase 1 n=1 Tax=Collichthys lucidus TaxID=240159 RepID=A0A4U5VC98_COLLU|nr:Phosphatidylcholine:ceramide cholinephosphotransferase 1 [Collichthys lucidus]
MSLCFSISTKTSSALLLLNMALSLKTPTYPLHCPLAKMKKVASWTAEDVSDWLSKEGIPEYIEALRQMDGPALLRLTEADFQKPPLSLVSCDGGQQLLERLETLRIENHIEAHKNGHANWARRWTT